VKLAGARAMGRSGPIVAGIAPRAIQGGGHMGIDNQGEIGPVDIIVIGYPAGAPMTGEAIPILLDLVDRGIVRVLDARFVRKDEDGSFSGFAARGLDRDTVGDLVAFEGATSGLLGDEDTATVAAAMEPGEAAAVLVYENRWAAPFAAAVRRNGGALIATYRVPSGDLMEALERLEPA
jgi:hypothetical protein